MFHFYFWEKVIAFTLLLLLVVVVLVVVAAVAAYLANMCQPVSTSSTRRHLRSAAHGNLVELRCRTTRYGKRSFPASAPLIWNSLPTTVRDVSTSMTSFSQRLKAELFRWAYGTDLVPMWQLSVNSLHEHKYSYLLTFTYLGNLCAIFDLSITFVSEQLMQSGKMFSWSVMSIATLHVILDTHIGNAYCSMALSLHNFGLKAKMHNCEVYFTILLFTAKFLCIPVTCGHVVLVKCVCVCACVH